MIPVRENSEVVIIYPDVSMGDFPLACFIARGTSNLNPMVVGQAYESYHH
jgi:hypothetical protein